MARARRTVEQPGLLIGRLAVAGEVMPLAAPTDEEAHQVEARRAGQLAVRAVWRLAALAQRV